jgi:hypothetical protein
MTCYIFWKELLLSIGTDTFPELRLLVKYFQHSQQLHVVKTFNTIMNAAYRQIQNIIL